MMLPPLKPAEMIAVRRYALWIGLAFDSLKEGIRDTDEAVRDQIVQDLLDDLRAYNLPRAMETYHKTVVRCITDAVELFQNSPDDASFEENKRTLFESLTIAEVEQQRLLDWLDSQK